MVVAVITIVVATAGIAMTVVEEDMATRMVATAGTTTVVGVVVAGMRRLVAVANPRWSVMNVWNVNSLEMV
jgi:hypothetical protein